MLVSSKPKFFGSIRQGKVEADANVAERLYERAMGYECDEEKMVQEGGKLVKTTTTKRFPPDFQSMALWLKNRRPNEWRETRHIRVENAQDMRLRVELSSELTLKLARDAGGSLDFCVAGESVDREAIEAVFSEIESDEPV